MPVVPIEENKVGIASLTDAKLRPGDFSGSGLEALGSGLQQVGGAGEELGKALGKIPAKKKELEKTLGETAAGQVPAANKQSEAIQKPLNKEGAQQNAMKPLAERAPKQTPKQAADDAAVKGAYNDYAEFMRSHLYGGNGAMAEQQGGDALAAAQPKAEQVLKARDDAAASLSPDLHEAFHAAIAPRVAQDLRFVQSHAAAAALIAQQQQSQRVVNNSAEDAVLQYGSPAFAESMATGLRQVDEQAATGGWTPEAKLIAETGFISRVHRGVSDAQAVSDPVLAAEHLRVFGDHMTPEDRASAWQSLQGPLTQTQAVADLDTLAIARSATAPLTPHGDGDSLMRRMLAITPAGPGKTGENQADTGAATNLPTLLDLYGGDAAKAWAASKIGADALDALVAKHGPGWFAALPAEARTAVAADMAMLNAVSSQRGAPAPAERGELAMAIADQPWSDERKQHAFDELNTRIALEARREKEAQDDAKEKGLAVAEQLHDRFISINQLPPAVRDHLAPDALAALKLRADRNVHPVMVAAHGDVAMDLNRMAANDPEAFAREDLRLHRDEMTSAEYEALSRVQKGVGTYPPAHAAMTQLRAMETIQRNGLDGSATGVGLANQPQAAPKQSLQTDEEVDRLANVDTIPEALRGADTTKAAIREMLRNDWTPDQIQNQLYEAYARRSLGLSSDDHPDADGSLPDRGNRDEIVPRARFRNIASEQNGQITFDPNGRPVVGPDGASPSDAILGSLFPPAQPVKKQVPSNQLDYGDFSTLWEAERKKGVKLPKFVPAEAWKKFAPDANKMHPETDARPYDRITLHHTGSEDTPQAVETLHGHEPLLHKLGRKINNPANQEDYDSYGDVGYHFLIGPDGTIYEGRSLAYQGAHVMDQNERNIGIAILGDYSRQPLNSAQIRSTKYLIMELNRAYRVNINAGGLPYVFTHRELAPSGEFARPDELVGAQKQTDEIEAWSRRFLPPLAKDHAWVLQALPPARKRR